MDKINPEFHKEFLNDAVDEVIQAAEECGIPEHVIRGNKVKPNDKPIMRKIRIPNYNAKKLIQLGILSKGESGELLGYGVVSNSPVINGAGDLLLWVGVSAVGTLRDANVPFDFVYSSACSPDSIS